MLLSDMKKARDRVSVVYLEFLIAFKSDSKKIFGFHEGKSDNCFYTSMATSVIPSSIDIELWYTGNKKRVLELYNKINWQSYPKERILFFIDRDLSHFINENLPKDSNIYITDYYSIENHLVNTEVCKRALKEIMGLTDLKGRQLHKIVNLFEKQLARFHQEMIPIMSHIMAWRLNGHKPSLNNLDLKQLFKFEAGRLKRKTNPAGCSSMPQYLCKKFSLSRKGLMKRYGSVKSQLQNHKEPKEYIRGKYELWFLTKFLISIRQSVNALGLGDLELSKCSCELCLDNAINHFAPRSPVPPSLRRFLKRASKKHLASSKAS